MSRVFIEAIGEHVGEEVTLKGWLYNKRHKGKLYFLLVRDGTETIQCVAYRPDVGDEVFARCDEVTQESAIEVRGTVKEDARSPIGYELSVKDVRILQLARDYPITPKEHGTAFLMDHRHLWLRSSRQHAILRVRAAIIRAARDFFDGRGFTLLDAPIFTPAACEGTTTLFETEYFGAVSYTHLTLPTILLV